MECALSQETGKVTTISGFSHEMWSKIKGYTGLEIGKIVLANDWGSAKVASIVFTDCTHFNLHLFISIEPEWHNDWHSCKRRGGCRCWEGCALLRQVFMIRGC